MSLVLESILLHTNTDFRVQDAFCCPHNVTLTMKANTRLTSADVGLHSTVKQHQWLPGGLEIKVENRLMDDFIEMVSRNVNCACFLLDSSIKYRFHVRTQTHTRSLSLT